MLEEEQKLKKEKASSIVKRKLGENKNAKGKKKNKSEKEWTKPKKALKARYKSRRESTSDDETEDSVVCLYCLEIYTRKENWIQCNKCKKWAHEKCVHKWYPDFFYCLNCDEDDDNEDIVL